MIMINPALKNLERELKDEEQELRKSETELKETVTKNAALEAEIKADEEKIRLAKAEIVKLENDIRFKRQEIQKNITHRQRVEGEVNGLRQKRDRNHLELTKLTRTQEDAVNKSKREGSVHSQTSFN